MRSVSVCLAPLRCAVHPCVIEGARERRCAVAVCLGVVFIEWVAEVGQHRLRRGEHVRNGHRRCRAALAPVSHGRPVAAVGQGSGSGENKAASASLQRPVPHEALHPLCAEGAGRGGGRGGRGEAAAAESATGRRCNRGTAGRLAPLHRCAVSSSDRRAAAPSAAASAGGRPAWPGSAVRPSTDGSARSPPPRPWRWRWRGRGTASASVCAAARGRPALRAAPQRAAAESAPAVGTLRSRTPESPAQGSSSVRTDRQERGRGQRLRGRLNFARCDRPSFRPSLTAASSA